MALTPRFVFFATTLALAASATLPLRAQDSTALFREKCGKCHAADGTGKTQAGSKMSVPDLRSKQVQAMTDEQLYESIAMGKQHKEYPHAYLYTGLTEPQIRSIVRLIRGLK